MMSPALSKSPVTREAIFDRLEAIDRLPTLPIVVQKLSAAINDSASDAGRLAAIIQDDPAIMARMLRIVNSALYRGSEEVTNLTLAISRLGFQTIRNIAMSTAVFSAFGSGNAEFDRDEFWKHSVFTGVAATVVYGYCRDSLSSRIPKDTLHLAGLIHDVGRIVMDEFFHDDFAKALALAGRELIPLHEAETQVMGASHDEIGAWLGTKWGLPAGLVEVLRWHHQPDNASDSHRDLVSVCHVANYICNFQQIGWSGDSVPGFDAGVWSHCGLSPSLVGAIVEDVQQQASSSELLTAFS
jgi:HD-like signal output (HDOD) protein